MQSLQHLKYSIIADLDALSEDNLAVLAKFIAFLRNETLDEEETKQDIGEPLASIQQKRHVLSPDAPTSETILRELRNGPV